ncbi:MAG: hypothetical protein DRJ49_04495 [Thermoprotei archaeon]|nr:MAG: hypothetical protein DRJ49_04495 [Thermoprotei archaeon]
MSSASTEETELIEQWKAYAGEEIFNALRIIRDAENRAREIVEKAKREAEGIIKSTRERLLKIYQESYRNSIVEVERKTQKILEKAKKEAEKEAELLMNRAKSICEDLRNKAEKRKEEAIAYVVKTILEV